MILELRLDRIVRLGKPRTPQFWGFFSFKNLSMGKKQGPMQIVVKPYGFENHDQFLRFERFLFVLAFPVNFGQYTGMKLWSDLEKMKKKLKNTKKNKD